MSNQVPNDIAIRNFGWACYNRLEQFVKTVYGPGHSEGYLREKINKAAKDPMAWYLDLDLGHRKAAAEIANSYYEGVE